MWQHLLCKLQEMAWLQIRGPLPIVDLEIWLPQVRGVKTRILHALSAIGAAASAVAALNLIGLASFLPPKVAAAVAVVPPIFATIGHAAIAIGDRIDDGKANNSFQCSPLAVVFACVLSTLCVMGLTSCVTTTTPDGTRTERYDAEATKPWLDLARDLFGPPRQPAPLIEPFPTK